MENCTAILNLTSFSWTSIPNPIPYGIIFNADWHYKVAYYIGSVSHNESLVYMVSIDTRDRPRGVMVGGTLIVNLELSPPS